MIHIIHLIIFRFGELSCLFKKGKMLNVYIVHTFFQLTTQHRAQHSFE